MRYPGTRPLVRRLQAIDQALRAEMANRQNRLADLTPQTECHFRNSGIDDGSLSFMTPTIELQK
jgi:hypothetical protein